MEQESIQELVLTEDVQELIKEESDDLKNDSDELFSKFEGRASVDMPSFFNDALGSYFYRKRLVKKYENLELGFKLTDNGVFPNVGLSTKESNKNVDSPTPKELAQDFLGIMDHYVMAVISNEHKFEDGEIVYCNVSENTLDEITDVVSLSEYLYPEKKGEGNARKDVILLGYMFEQMFGWEGKSSHLSEETYKNIGNYIIDGLENYQEVLKGWKERNKRRKSIAPRELVRNHVIYNVLGGKYFNKKKLNPGEKRELKDLNKVVDKAWKYISHPNKDAVELNLFPDNEGLLDRPYFKTNLSDGLILNDGKVIGGVKDFGYPHDVFQVYVNQLRLHETLEDSKKVDDLTKRTLKSLGFWGKELTTFITPGYGDEYEGMTLGLDVKGVRNLLQAIRNIPDEIDDVSPDTGEVKTIKYDPKFPILLRFPKDVSEEDLQKYVEIIEKNNIENIIIQKLAVTNKEMRLFEYWLLERWYKQQEEGVEIEGVGAKEDLLEGRYGNVFHDALEILHNNTGNIWEI